MCPDAKLFFGMPSTILSFNVVHMDSVVIIVLIKKVKKQVNWIRDQRTKRQGNKGTAKKL